MKNVPKKKNLAVPRGLYGAAMLDNAHLLLKPKCIIFTKSEHKIGFFQPMSLSIAPLLQMTPSRVLTNCASFDIL